MSEKTALSIFVAVEGAHAYSAFLPSIFTIRTFRQEAGTRRSISDGELVGSLFTLALGAVTSALIKDKLPLLFSVVTVIVMVSVYEWALRS